ncbi:hypothetical protein V8G54_021627 [Vigna mungo]|uniref:Uncharacterized protein n=1 Tax=Vigna mungo TaxID=3915 RepID=A0AAQ3RXU5_VIGMU
MVVSPQCPSCVGGVLKAIESVGWIGGEKLGVKGKNGWGLTSPKSSVCVWKKNLDHPPILFLIMGSVISVNCWVFSPRPSLSTVFSGSPILPSSRLTKLLSNAIPL